VPGGQAEYLRVPFGNTLPIKVPDGPPDDRFVYLSDVLPTAWQAVQYAATRPAAAWCSGWARSVTCAPASPAHAGERCRRLDPVPGARRAGPRHEVIAPPTRTTLCDASARHRGRGADA
jgi:hypothetical protein